MLCAHAHPLEPLRAQRTTRRGWSSPVILQNLKTELMSSSPLHNCLYTWSHLIGPLGVPKIKNQMCMCAHECRDQGRQRRASDSWRWSYKQLWAYQCGCCELNLDTVQEQEILNWWTIPSAPYIKQKGIILSFQTAMVFCFVDMLVWGGGGFLLLLFGFFWFLFFVFL